MYGGNVVRILVHFFFTAAHFLLALVAASIVTAATKFSFCSSKEPRVAFVLPYLLIELFNIGMSVVRTDARGYGHVITKFSRMGRLPHFLTRGAPLGARELL